MATKNGAPAASMGPVPGTEAVPRWRWRYPRRFIVGISHIVRGGSTRTKRLRVLPGPNRSKDPAGDVSAAGDAKRQRRARADENYGKRRA